VAVDDILYGGAPKEPEPVPRPQTSLTSQNAAKRALMNEQLRKKRAENSAAAMEYKPIQGHTMGVGVSSEFIKPKEVMPTISMTAPRQQPAINLADFDERSKASMMPTLSKSKTQTEVHLR
jgi:hypothetical protein